MQRTAFHTHNRFVGQGARGAVYADPVRKTARKYPLPESAGNVVLVSNAASVTREGVVLSALDHHPNMIEYVSHGEVDGQPYLETRLIEGKSLKDVLLSREGRYKPLPLLRALRVTDDIAQVLYHVHQQGIVHTDVKPGNIELAGRRAILTDFEGAREEDQFLLEEENFKGCFVGGLAYCSPRRLRGLPPNRRDDMFSLGLVLSFMLSPICVLSDEEAESCPQGVIVAVDKKHQALAVNIAKLQVHKTVRFLIAGLTYPEGERYFPDCQTVSRYIRYITPKLRTIPQRVSGLYGFLVG